MRDGDSMADSGVCVTATVLHDGGGLETDSDDRQNSGQRWTVWWTAATQRRTALRTVMESADSADSDGRQDSEDTAATQRRTATTELRTV